MRAAGAALARGYGTVRHSSLLPETWVISDGNPNADYAAERVAGALGVPHRVKRALPPRLPVPIARALAGLGSALGLRRAEALQFVDGTRSRDGMPRFVVAAAQGALPGVLEIKRLTGGRAIAVFLGLPGTGLAQIDALALSRLDQMVLRRMGPARANLDNAVAALLPLTGAVAGARQPAKEPTVAVCVGRGFEPAGYQLLSTHIDSLVDGLAHIPPSRLCIALSAELHPRLRPMVEARLVRPLLQRWGPRAEVVDYARPGSDRPALADVIASAAQVIATADNVGAAALAAALRRPVYIASEERTEGLLRDYYHLLEKENVVRRFYPRGSRYSYMLAPDIGGAVDVFSAVRDHEPWAKYSAQRDLDRLAAFVRARFRDLMG
ncbi:hypothetical protein H4R18_001607 [Coemansia javaensis]|uniref:Nucleoside-diphosphate sugar epimerase n=1 Tax=Coemansia javaensis TaxID=2761396 RepID=A0A9W8HDA6_9FUNG|nr:hypothetical protein H4R18_001607 [Coemansia javaensis]